jgi:hypothetical protein
VEFWVDNDDDGEMVWDMPLLRRRKGGVPRGIGQAAQERDHRQTTNMVAPAGIFSTIVLTIIIVISLRTSLAFSVGPPSRPTHPRVKDTKVTVAGKATVAIAPPPIQHALSHNVTLTHYMRLPVDQYVLIPMPLGSSLNRMDNIDGDVSPSSIDYPSECSEFELVVPTISFFKLSLQPVVYATVQPHLNRVVISSTKCVLCGSPFIEKVKLNDRFDFSVNCTLTWEDPLSNSSMSQLGEIECSITSETCIKVDVDVPKPFRSIPKRLIERAGNAAMKVSLNYIQANFVDNLATDYENWATNSEYRIYRASLSAKEVRVVRDAPTR